MARFGVCRATVRQALHELCDRGIVTARQGKGYYVSRLTAVHSLERLQSFGEMMAPLGVKTHSVLIELIEIAASREVAEALRIMPGETVMRTVRTRLAAGTVVSLDVSFFPLDIGRRLRAHDLEHNDIFLLFENELGTELGFADLLIDLVPCRTDHASLLGVDAGQPVIRIRRLSHDNNGRPIDYEHLFARQDALQFKVRAARW
jgi:GntR family transcriptional regulator